MQDYCIMLNSTKIDIDSIIKKINESNNNEICISYISDFSTTKHIRQILTYICEKYKLSFIIQTRLILLVDELNNNAIEYGSKNGEINKFNFYLNENIDNIDIVVEVSDTGNGNQAKSAKQMEKIQSERLKKGFVGHQSIRGRGLFMIIEKIADKLYFKDNENGGLTVGAKLSIKK